MFGNLISFENLFDEFRRMEQDIDQLLGRGSMPAGIRSAARGTFPATNVGATSDAVSVYLFAPGVDPKNVNLQIQQNLLLVSGERRLPVHEKATYYRQERIGGQFRRVITLPDDVDPDRVDAKYRDGILHIVLQRRAAPQPRRIDVN